MLLAALIFLDEKCCFIEQFILSLANKGCKRKHQIKLLQSAIFISAFFKGSNLLKIKPKLFFQRNI